MSDENVPKRRGRPPKPESDRKDGNLTFRTRSGMRERLSVAAEASGRSISEEVERRLERSLDEDFDRLRVAMFGEPDTALLLRKIVFAARLIEEWHVKDKGNVPTAWSGTSETRAAMRKAVQKIVVDATPYRNDRGLLQDIVDGKMGAPDPIAEAEDRGFLIGRVITGNLDDLEIKNLGMGSSSDW